MKTKKPLRLYVWTKVLCDYTCGVMFAYASSVAEARKLCAEATHDPDSFMVKEDLSSEPEVVRTAKGFAVYGGG